MFLIYGCVWFVNPSTRGMLMSSALVHSIIFCPITLECRRGTTDDFETISFHLVLFSAAQAELAHQAIVVSVG